MPRARRHRHGADLEYLLEAELAVKQHYHPEGFVVRPHILGDFYDIAYAALWLRWMGRFPALHVFGYTAHSPKTAIGSLVRRMNRDFPARCVMRFSGCTDPELPTARTIYYTPDDTVVDGGIVCPAQTGAVACCGACGLCWTMTKPVVFLAHGNIFAGRPPGSKLAAE